MYITACSTVMIAIIDKFTYSLSNSFYFCFHFMLEISCTHSTRIGTYENTIKQTSLSYNNIRSTFRNEPIKRMLFVMFSYISTLVPICLLRHHPRHSLNIFFFFMRIMKQTKNGIEGVCTKQKLWLLK